MRLKRDRYPRLFLHLGLRILCPRMGRLSANGESEKPRLHHCEIRLHAVIPHYRVNSHLHAATLRCHVYFHRCVKCESPHCHSSHPQCESLHHDVNHRSVRHRCDGFRFLFGSHQHAPSLSLSQHGFQGHLSHSSQRLPLDYVLLSPLLLQNFHCSPLPLHVLQCVLLLFLVAPKELNGGLTRALRPRATIWSAWRHTALP